MVEAAALALVETVGHLGGECSKAGCGQVANLAFVFSASVLRGKRCEIKWRNLNGFIECKNDIVQQQMVRVYQDVAQNDALELLITNQ
mmetsp:Transcript_32947/g.67661  ORF Transcript_32947/g.67661 Transcript_32947/m.67661 type:complete len:88 (+) Transcript_32947:1122-1385(+)